MPVPYRCMICCLSLLYRYSLTFHQRWSLQPVWSHFRSRNDIPDILRNPVRSPMQLLSFCLHRISHRKSLSDPAQNLSLHPRSVPAAHLTWSRSVYNNKFFQSSHRCRYTRFQLPLPVSCNRCPFWYFSIPDNRKRYPVLPSRLLTFRPEVTEHSWSQGFHLSAIHNTLPLRLHLQHRVLLIYLRNLRNCCNHCLNW